jgi:hypothetical protein
MATRLLALAFCTVFLLGASVVKEPSETLTVKDSEHPEALVNTRPDATDLRMTITTPKGDLKKGEECEVKVEIYNPSAYIEIVYMPALTVAPAFVPDKKNLRVDEYGPPMVFGRMSAKDERLNYVVLMGGDSYARTYRWTPPDSGQVSFRAVYLNRKNGEEIGVKAWTGELRSESKHLRISAQ